MTALKAQILGVSDALETGRRELEIARKTVVILRCTVHRILSSFGAFTPLHEVSPKSSSSAHIYAESVINLMLT